MWLYGLVTARGEIVVDPVYSDAYQLSWYDYENSRVVYEPYLYLTKVHYDAQAGREEKDITVAALDGSWWPQRLQQSVRCQRRSAGGLHGRRSGGSH